MNMHAKTLSAPRRSANVTSVMIDSVFGKVERSAIRKYTGHKFTENEAQYLLPRITDHKWYLSEQLSRDVGFYVAAVDYLEHFYQPPASDRSEINSRRLMTMAKSLLRFYFEAKGSMPPL